jgi:hypothetical protein
MSRRLSRALADRRSLAVARAGLRPLAVFGALAASLVLVACGTSGSTTTSAASLEKSREQKFLLFTKCLREHGINVSTPTAGGRIRLGVKGINPRTFEVARTACKKYAPFDRPNLTPAERVAREEAVRKFARCMREHGIDIKAETRAGGAGIAIGIHRSQGGPNPESPAFEAAQKACQEYLPKRPGGGRFGGPGGGPTTNRSGGGGGPNLGFQTGG